MTVGSLGLGLSFLPRLLGVLLLYRFVPVPDRCFRKPRTRAGVCVCVCVCACAWLRGHHPPGNLHGAPGVIVILRLSCVCLRHALPDQQSQPGQPRDSGVAVLSRSRRGNIDTCRSAVFPPIWATITWATKSCFVPRPLRRLGANSASACLLCWGRGATAVQEHFQTVAYEQALRVESACVDCDDVSSADAESESCLGRHTH